MSTTIRLRWRTPQTPDPAQVQETVEALCLAELGEYRGDERALMHSAIEVIGDLCAELDRLSQQPKET